MATTTTGRVLLKFFIPSQFHHLVNDAILDKKGISKLFAELADKAPDQYSKIVSDLTRLGFEVATRQGTSITLKDLVSPINKDKLWDEFDHFKSKVDAGKDSRAVKDKKIFDKYNDMMSSIEKDILTKGLQENKSLAKIIMAGSRGSPAQYRGTIATQGIVVDGEGKPKMDIPIKSSYAEGLTLPEYLTTSFGTRSGEVLKKISVAQGGYGSKQFARALMPLQVVEADCDTMNGVDVAVSDRESIGAYLAKSAGNYNRNNEVTAKMLNDLTHNGVHRITIRSPMTCQSNKKHHSGGLCQMCVGKREKGMAAMDSYIGLVAGTAVAEPLTESAMKARHCLFSDTVVAYPQTDNNKAIKDVKVGDTIIGATKSGKLLPTQVLAIHDQGQQDVYRYTFRYGKTNEKFSIEATEDHVVLGGTYNCYDISKNNPELLKIGTKHKKFHLYLGGGFDDSSYTDNEPYAFLLGLLLGDGSYTIEKGKIQYYNFDLSSIAHIQDKLSDLGLKLVQNSARFSQYSVAAQASECLVPTISTASCFGVVYKNPAKLKLEELGMWGKAHYEKTIPDAAYQWTNTAVAELLSGLFYTDGSVNFDKDNSKNSAQIFKSYSYFSASKKLVTQIKYFLETRFGIYTSAVTTNNKKGKVYNIEGRTGTCKHNSYGIRIRRPEAVQRFDETIKLFGAKFNKCQGVSFHKAKELNRTHYRCNLVSVEHLGTRHCYDLTVDCPDNLFMLANGAIVHNSGGAATSLGGQQGFKLINQLANIPKTFIGKAPLAQEDGFITKLTPAAAGGHFITVNNEEHYIGLDQTPKVKLGDRVEQGQVLSSGLVDPRDVVALRGIGDGRKYYMEAMKKAFDDSGLPVNRRNFELIAKAAIDHVKITDHNGIGDYLPEQVVSYSAIEKDYQPRPDSKQLRLDLAYGKYLEKPELHYTIGTKVTTAVINHLKEHHVESVLVHDEHPHFEPAMVRLVDIPEHHDDWMHVLNSTNLAKRFVNMVNKGATSDTQGPSPIPGLAYGVDFGKKH
jgi:hypothetical protein